MTNWNPDELQTFGDAEEIDIAPRRSNGSLRPFTTIWAVRVGDDLYVRSFRGPDGGWYRRARASGGARVRVGDHELDVDASPARNDTDDAITDAYQAKYSRYGESYLGPMTAPGAVDSTLRLTPAT